MLKDKTNNCDSKVLDLFPCNGGHNCQCASIPSAIYTSLTLEVTMKECDSSRLHPLTVHIVRIRCSSVYISEHQVGNISLPFMIFIENDITLLGTRKSMSAECKADEIDLATFEEAFVK